MANFNVSVGGLNLRAVADQDLAALGCHVGDLQTFEHVSSRNPAVRRFGARSAVGSSVAHALLSASVALNHQGLTVWLKSWLRNNGETIRDRLDEEGDEVFVVLANWLEGQGAHSTIVTGREIHLIGTVKDMASLSELLTPAKLYGPKAHASPPNSLHAFRSAYLVGSRVGAGDKIAASAVRPLWTQAPDLSALKRYGL